MFPFFWPTEVKFPRAGGNFQNISPTSGWFSTTVNYKGSPEIENRVAEEVASNGKQLGAITEALLELANEKKGEKLERLRSMHKEIVKIKERTTAEMCREAQETFEALADRNKAKAKQLAEQMLEKLG
ncbi:hypothetical protein [Breoghania sp.]|uniref:hypothetical protein n=1 Tax=Breoghania sp. TaxID=2065378 RepID=UPI00260BF687|nr:hypothetical protein [Breoghania sp.]MDJ0929870.1 hypothetical protein [Breoghania sp.]